MFSFYQMSKVSSYISKIWIFLNYHDIRSKSLSYFIRFPFRCTRPPWEILSSHRPGKFLFKILLNCQIKSQWQIWHSSFVSKSFPFQQIYQRAETGDQDKGGTDGRSLLECVPWRCHTSCCRGFTTYSTEQFYVTTEHKRWRENIKTLCTW